MDAYQSSASPYPQYPPYPREPRRSRWWVPVVIIIVTMFGVLALMTGIVASLVSPFKTKSVSVKEGTVLHLKIRGALEERASFDVSSLFDNDESTTFLDALLAIKRAKNDDNIVGMYFKGGDLRAGFSKASELRSALEEFKTSGKFIYAFIETGDERDYYLASVADSVFMPTEGLLEMNGFASTGVFVKGFLEKIGVEFYVQQFEEYKSAAEQVSRTAYSEAAKQELRPLLEQRMSVFTSAIAQSRKLDAQEVRAALMRGVYSSDSLLALKFIDGIRGESRVKDALKERIARQNSDKASNNDKNNDGNNAEKDKKNDATTDNEESSKSSGASKLRLVSLGNYLSSESYKESDDEEEKVEKDTYIAIIAASGTIVSQGDADENLVASAFIKSLQKARDNKKVKAIILRIDSPGGSAIASDAMWEEIQRTRARKPVYASMSDVAASGGYYMAMPCDTIIAHPTTITGSIGVIIALPLAGKMLNNLGVTVDTVVTSPAAIPYDPALPITEENKKKLFMQSEGIYKRFVGRMAEARKKSFEEARAVAKGRVWTGVEAKERGLVDTLGGIQTAIAIAKRRLGLDSNTKVVIKRYPEQRDQWEALIEKFFDTNRDNESRAEAEEPTLLSRLQAALERDANAKALQHIPLWNLLPEPVQEQMRYLLHLASVARRERVLMAAPQIPVLR